MELNSPTKPPPHTTSIKTLAEHLSTYQPNHDPTSITQKIRDVTSITIWAQKYNPQAFNEFFNNKILQKMLNIFVKSKQRDLMIVIQSLSIMITNFQKQEGIIRLLYDPAMLSFLMIKSNGMTVQVAEYYINLLKTLTSRIDQKTLPLIFNKKQPSFALAWQAARFYNHPQLLIRAASRTIILSLMKINQPIVKKYFSSFPFVIYFSHLTLFLKQYWFKMNEIMQEKWDAQKTDIMRLPEIVDNHFDILLYIQDLLDNGGKGVNQCMINAFCTYLLSDILYCLKSQKKQQFSVGFCLYVLGVIYKAIKNPLLIEIITIVIFGNYSLVKVTQKIQESRFSYLDSYNKRWSFKNMWDPFDDELAIYHKYIFDQQERNLAKNPKAGFSNIGIVTETLYLFGIVTNPKFNQQVDKLAKIYGFNMLAQKKITKYDSIAQIFECLKYKLTQAMIDPQQFDQNPLKQILLQFLADDNMVMQVLQLYINLFTNTAVTRQTLSFCRLNVHQRIHQFYTRISIQKLLTCCFHILATYPTLRLCTIYNTIKLIMILSNPYEQKKDIINQQMRQLLYKAIKISVDVMNLKISNYKNQAPTVVSIQDKKQFGIGAYGLVIQHQITSLYQKVTFTDKEELQKNIHYHFMLKKFAYHLFPKQILFSPQSISPLSESPISSFAESTSIPCRLIQHNQALQCYLVLQKQHLIIIYPITSQEPPTGNVYEKILYRKLNFSIQESKKLIISIINSSCVVEKTIILLFENSKKCSEIKEKLDEKKDKISEQSLEVIRKQLQTCLEKAKVLEPKKSQKSSKPE